MAGEVLGARVSPELRELVRQAGTLNPGTRALLILGAHAAGLDVGPCRAEIGALLHRGGLAPAVAVALAGLLGVRASISASTSASSFACTPAEGPTEELEDDPFAVGIEV